MIRNVVIWRVYWHYACSTLSVFNIQQQGFYKRDTYRLQSLLPNVCLSGALWRENVWEPLLQTVQNCREAESIFHFRAQHTQHGLDRLSACMLSLWNDRTISPCSWRKRKRINVTAVNKYEDDGEVSMWDAKHFFTPSQISWTWKAVIANLIHEHCDTLSHDKVLCCLSGVRNDHNWGQRLLTSMFSYEQPENCFDVLSL